MRGEGEGGGGGEVPAASEIRIAPAGDTQSSAGSTQADISTLKVGAFASRPILARRDTG